VDLVQEADRPLRVRSEPLPRPAITSRTGETVAETAESSSKYAPVVFAITRASVVFPLPGGP
jgi:cell division protein FtsI/penicillin-binding protein 2